MSEKIYKLTLMMAADEDFMKELKKEFRKDVLRRMVFESCRIRVMNLKIESFPLDEEEFYEKMAKG
jgi:hypothetical protein